ncbi:MAG: plastocyanin/azurin family copper-binding protein [Methanoregula sp.]|jgi:plastocyanin|uniref:plastocyanin/azurin family copper-binding protein n=1 Tax=Methanoregula sp. TaxID=2052170 RepID=UPI003D0F5B5E
MKHILLLCMAVIFLQLMAGCTQTAQQGQPAATPTPAPANTVTISAPVATTTVSVSDNTVLIQNMAYNPAQITVKAGEIVRWVNKDKVVHSVVFSKDSKIDPSGPLSASQSFSVKFYDTGVYNYSCGIHPQMQGSVVVI